MARQQIKQYVFVPGTAGNGYVQIPGNYSSAAITAILNATNQAFIYNFADNTLLGTVTWSPIPNANFPASIDGVTTITLNTNTSGYSATDKLAIYAEVPYIAQRPFALDAVERQRVANPQSLIDADFEYGLQNTKWQSLFVNNDNPSIYEVPGSDVYANSASYIGFIGNAIVGTTTNLGNATILSNWGTTTSNVTYVNTWATTFYGPIQQPTIFTAATGNLSMPAVSQISIPGGVVPAGTVLQVSGVNLGNVGAPTTTIGGNIVTQLVAPAYVGTAGQVNFTALGFTPAAGTPITISGINTSTPTAVQPYIQANTLSAVNTTGYIQFATPGSAPIPPGSVVQIYGTATGNGAIAGYANLANYYVQTSSLSSANLVYANGAPITTTVGVIYGLTAVASSVFYINTNVTNASANLTYANGQSVSTAGLSTTNLLFTLGNLFYVGGSGTSGTSLALYSNFASAVTNTGGAIALTNAVAGNTNGLTFSTVSVSYTGNNQPNWTPGDYAITWNNDARNFTTYLTANIASLNQRALTVGSTTGFNPGDNVLMIYAPNVSTITTTTSNLTAGQTSLTIAGANVIVNGSMIMVFTGNYNAGAGYTTELMTVTAGGGSGALTVSRNRANTNVANSYIVSGSTVAVVGQAEVANVVSIDSSTQISVQRSYMNTQASDTMPVGTVIQRINWEPSNASGTNVEIVQLTTVSNAPGNTVVIQRNQLGTAATSTLGIGSPILRLSGIFTAGTNGLPLIAVNLKGHAFYPNAALSTTNHTNARSEGQFQVANIATNYFTYYPKIGSGQPIGYPLNRWDTVIRYAGFYGTASLPPVSLSADGGNPATITASTAYAHGVLPGTPILANIASAGGGSAYASGSFTVLTVPSPVTFTFQAKTGVAVTNPLVGSVYVRPSAFFVHRASDGGVNLGTGTAGHGASAARQTKKYFRYQSGKGLMWTSGTLLGTNFDIVNVFATGTGIGNTINITTDLEHQLQIGANVQLLGINTTGYNGYYLVQQVISENQIQANVTTPLGSATGVQVSTVPRLATVAWTGASVRAGIFDAQNGVFWENTGSSINIVQRTAANYMIGTISVEVSSQLVTGDGTTKFTQQFLVGDRIVLRGMSHTVTTITDDNTMTVSPVWRGLTNQTRIKPSKVLELRYPQAQWNIDRLDGNGPSGYKLDVTKMQMLMIQYTWYGAGFVDFGVRGPNGNYVFAHRIMNNNINYKAYMRSGNLPARYEAINDTPLLVLNSNSTSYLYTGINSTDTTFTVFDATQFPPVSPTQPVYVMIENEVLKVTGITYGSSSYSNVGGNVTPATLTGVTRAATYNLFQDGANKAFSAGSANVHVSNVAVRIISATNAPSLNHWGSAVILDGGFDTDRGYAYTYQAANVVFPSGVSSYTATTTAMAIRLAPSVSNQIPGDLGTRDLVNRAQLILQNMIVNFSGANISTGQGARYLIEGILNPNNISTTNTVWGYLFNSGYSASTNPSSAVQPSYAQVAQGNISGLSSNIAFTGVNTTYAWGGERLFAIPVNSTNSGQLDLSMVKQIGNSGIPGFNIYPDGPELLAINITSLVPQTSLVTGEIQVQWNESQA